MGNTGKDRKRDVQYVRGLLAALGALHTFDEDAQEYVRDPTAPQEDADLLWCFCADAWGHQAKRDKRPHT